MGTLPRRPLAEVLPVAEDLIERLRPACERIEIAGSIRRQRPEVGDIEFVAIPKFESRQLTHQRSLFDTPTQTSAKVNLLWETIDRLNVSYTKEGPIYRQFMWWDVRVDCYTC